MNEITTEALKARAWDLGFQLTQLQKELEAINREIRKRIMSPQEKKPNE